jgi:uncharacterized membrane protein (UPF0127 family)
MSQCYRPTLLFAMLAFGILTACSQSPAPEWKPGDTITTRVGTASIELELALTNAQRTKGLMHRTSLPKNRGMLFVFAQPEPRSFWMKNTQIPLDIAYLDSSGRIVEIHKLYPHNQNGVSSRSRAIQFALEVNQGWFKENGVQAGDSLDFSPFRKILLNSGYTAP